ncbi:hypothetical protein Ae201684_002226 [Aphanomyces euteiches]|uniref:Uncharacterized protein n=1 Tax=Aphanomyces euteiches TaxID=100861 RepID=A0A6G0XQK8_9STRA|nr:hypothetical protein Ae201684_002226 [Aphanomyces euteiches]
MSVESATMDELKQETLAWDNNQFTNLLQTDLLTYSLSVSIAPITKVIETMGSTLHKHDETLRQLLNRMNHAETKQDQANEMSAATTEDLRSQIQEATQGVRADLLALIHSLEVKNNAIEQAVQASNDKLDNFAAESSRSSAPEAPTRDENEITRRLDHLEKLIDGLQKQNSSSPSLPTNYATCNDDVMKQMQAQLNTMQQFMQSELENERQRINEMLRDQAINSKSNESKALPSPTSLLKRAQSHSSGLRPDALELVKANSSDFRATVDLAPVYERLDREEQLLEALRQQIEGLQENLDQVHADSKKLQDEVSNIATPFVAPEASAIPIVPSLALEPQNEVLENEVHRLMLLLEGLTQEIREIQSQQSARNRDRDNKLNEFEKHIKALETADLVHNSLLDTQKASIQKMKPEIAKIASDLQGLIDNQSLMQSFSSASSGGDAPDLSMVFAKLAEMRKAQQDENQELKNNIDATVDSLRENQQQLSALKSDVIKFDGKLNSHDIVLEAQKDREAVSNAHLGRQLEAQIASQKDLVQRGLNIQERVMTSLHDLSQQAAELRQDFDKDGAVDKAREIQKLFQAFYHIAPHINHVLAIPLNAHDTLLRIFHSIDAGHLPPDQNRALLDSLNVVHQMLSSLELHNETLNKQNELSRSQLDEVCNAWNSKLHADALAKITLFSKELRDLVKQAPRTTVVAPPQQNNNNPVKHALADTGDGKVLETKLVATNRRLSDIEDNLRILSKNITAYKQDMNEKVTAGNLSKLKFQVFSELAKIHAFLGSARFQGPPGVPLKVAEEGEIKATLDAQAEHIAGLCNDLKQSIADKAKEGDGPATNSLSKLSSENDGFNAKLDAITEKVADLFLTLERTLTQFCAEEDLHYYAVNRSAIQPKHSIPTYNPAQLLDSFAQNIEAKLTETQNSNRKQIECIKEDLNDLVRQRVSKALQSLPIPLAGGDETTAAASKPMMCIACSRPVKLEGSVQGSKEND